MANYSRRHNLCRCKAEITTLRYLVFGRGPFTMKPQFSMVQAVCLGVLFSSSCAIAQTSQAGGSGATLVASSSSVTSGFRSSGDGGPGLVSKASAFGTTSRYGAESAATVSPFSAVGLDSHVGIGGIGFDMATPLAKRFNIRAGSDFFSYSTSFQEQGANVAANLHLRSGHASLDWFPFGGRFRVSPLLVFANNNQATGTAVVPAGSTVSLNGQNYISSATDPLHGGGSIDFRKFSPGLSLGFGDIIPRTGRHFSFPVELGFYYAGQPGLKVNFTGSACDPSEPAAIGCQSVNQDASFQQNLKAFIARNNHNLSYASFFPILSIGVGYRF